MQKWALTNPPAPHQPGGRIDEHPFHKASGVQMIGENMYEPCFAVFGESQIKIAATDKRP